MIDAYFQDLQNLISANSLITAVVIQMERRSETIGSVRGDLTFRDGSHLHFQEFVRKEEKEPAERYTYVYHYQSPTGHIVFRYDNTNHYPALENAPHHKHVGEDSVTSAQVPDLSAILKELRNPPHPPESHKCN